MALQIPGECQNKECQRLERPLIVCRELDRHGGLSVCECGFFAFLSNWLQINTSLLFLCCPEPASVYFSLHHLENIVDILNYL